MRVADLFTAAVLMLLGGVVIYDALRLGIGWGTDGPKSGFFPFWLAGLMVVTCAAIVIQAARRPAGKTFLTWTQAMPVLKVLGPAVGLGLLMGGVKLGDLTLIPAAGLYVAAALYVAVYMRWIGRHAWPLTIVLAVGIPLATFLLFERWFLVPMPKGPLEAWLGY